MYGLVHGSVHGSVLIYGLVHGSVRWFGAWFGAIKKYSLCGSYVIDLSYFTEKFKKRFPSGLQSGFPVVCKAVSQRIP